MREATASRDADLAVGVVALSSASHAVSWAPFRSFPPRTNLVAEAVYALTTHRSYCRRAGCPGPRVAEGTYSLIAARLHLLRPGHRHDL